MSLWSKLGGLFGGAAPVWKEAWRVDAGGNPVALQPCGPHSLVVLTGEGRLLRLDARDGTKRFDVEAHAAGALCVDVAEQIATGGMDGLVRVFDKETGAFDRELSLGRGWVTHLLWQKRLGEARVTNPALIAAHGKFLARIEHTGASPEGERAAQYETLGPHPSTVGALALSHDGSKAAAGYFGGVDVWSLEDDTAPQTLPWSSSIVSLAWRPNGSVVAAGCQDNAVHFWRLPSGQDSQMGGYPSKPKVLAWSPKGDLLGTAAGKEAVLWDFEKGPEGTSPIQLHGHAASITAMVWSSDGKWLVTGARDGRVLVHQVADGSVLHVAEFGAAIEALHWDAGFVVACASGVVARVSV